MASGRGTPAPRRAALDLRLRFADQHAAEDREAEAGAEVPRRLGDARDLAVAGAGRAADGVGAGRGEHQPDAGRTQHDARDLAAEREVGQLAREQVEADRAERAADHDRAPSAAAVEHAPADERADQEPEEEVEDVDTGVRGRPAERDLRVDAREEEERHEHDRQQQQRHVVHREAPVGEDLQPQQRVRDAQLAQAEGHQQSCSEDDAQPGRHAAPAPARGLLQARAPRAPCRRSRAQCRRSRAAAGGARRRVWRGGSAPAR